MHKNTNNIFIRVHALPGEQYLVHSMLLLIAFTVAGYAFFVVGSISNVITYKEALAQSDRLQSEVGMLEEEYFALSRTVTPALAAGMGMQQTADTTFVRRPGAVGSAQGAREL